MDCADRAILAKLMIVNTLDMQGLVVYEIKKGPHQERAPDEGNILLRCFIPNYVDFTLRQA